MAFSLRPVTLPPVGQVGLITRVRVVLEILIAYAPLARRLHGNDIAELIALARRPGPRDAVDEVEQHQVAIRLGKMVLQVLRVLPTDARCLIRSLVLLRLLDRRSIDATLVIGVHTEGEFGAHAWVEQLARPVLPTGRVTRLVEL